MHVGVVVGLSLCVPLFASVSVVSFPLMPMWTLTLCMEILCGVQYMWYNATTSSLSGWWCCEDGCLTRLFMRNKMLRLYVNMCVSTWAICMVFYGNEHGIELCS